MKPNEHYLMHQITPFPRNPKLTGTWLLVAIVLGLWGTFWNNATLLGQTTLDDSANESKSNWNVPIPTLGGKQFWSDVRCYGNWKIQRNAVDGHHRLLDDRDIRRAWGSLEACNHELQQQIDSKRIKGHSGRLIILLHGLIRTHDSMNKMAAYLQENSTQPLETICFQYASSQANVGQHAHDLDQFISQLQEEVTEIYLVAHSLGNIVIRHYLQDNRDLKTNQLGDPRIKRIVMLGPPNQGSRAARLLKNSLAFRVVTGESGKQLAWDWEKLESQLATPKQEFAIIAGGDETPSFIEQKVFGGPTDYTVSVEETQLAGASDSIVLPVIHGLMMYDPEVRKATLSLLEHGYLVSPEQKKPIQ